ncbi:MAG TPA: peptide chain release factor N(5)-glutamine methyltransferase [Pyrinomonadaceae bacterium]|nr:peptide chain release factor N(5)-glutamine methyltransferase [Pyrinomonadaceae bacterium]
MGVSIAAAIAEATAKLKTQGVTAPRLEASLLLEHAIKRDRTFIIAHSEVELSPEQSQAFERFLARRADGEPLQYITGHQEFFKLDFEVTPDVLIPRPETELIVETILDLFPPATPFRFADVGTGSGCIAISILCEREQAHATAIDQSARALEVARRNAARHQVTERLRVAESDLFTSLRREEVFDAIVSNPPYIPEGEVATLQREVQREPSAALAGGRDGLDVIRRLLNDALPQLKAGGYLIFEFGINQDRAILELVNRDVWELVEIRKDLQQIPRMIILRNASC